MQNRISFAKVGDLGLDFVQVFDELFDLLPRFLRLGSRLSAHQIGDVAEVEETLGRGHEACFDLRVNIGDGPGSGDSGRKDAGQGVVIAAGDRVELVIVAAGTGNGKPEHAAGDHVNALVPIIHVEVFDDILGQAAVLVIDRPRAQKAGGGEIAAGRFGDQVGGKLQRDELVVRHSRG